VRAHPRAVAADTPLRAAPAPAYEEGYRITTLHPRTYNEARQIGEHFRSGTPVIMNLTEMDDTDAKRLVDFAAG
jgi:cell division inhibitor SepF